MYVTLSLWETRPQINPYPANVENMVSSLFQQMADGI